MEYQRASDLFAKFLTDVKNESGLGSVHQAYTMAQGVFQVFRRRLKIKESIIFTSALNAGLRALYIADWDPEEKKAPFDFMEIMNREVKHLRPDHNFSTDTAIQEVGRALKKNVDAAGFDRMLKKLPVDAQNFWRL
jgi:uncharacterized protein (DUF2267 family)